LAFTCTFSLKVTVLLRLLIGFAAAAAVTAAAWWTEVAPPWPSATPVLTVTFLVALASQVSGQVLIDPQPLQRTRVTAKFLLLAACLAAAYAVLWIAFTHPVSSPEKRVVGSWAYSAVAQEHVEHQSPPPPVSEVLADMENNPELVFERSSLLLTRAILLGTWVAAVGAAMLGLTQGVRLLRARMQPATHPELATLHQQLAACPASVPDKLSGELHRALQTLEQAENVPGAILTVAGMLEGPHGLLGELAAQHGQALQGFNLLEQIEGLASRSLMPKEVVSDCHWIRVRANMARHRKDSVTLEDARMAISRGICIVQWYAQTAPAEKPPAEPSP
jgi:hypothetical protein